MQGDFEKMSLSKCKSALQKDGSVYSDEEVLKIRDFLYRLAEIEYEAFQRHKLRDLEFEKLKSEEYKEAA